jgi:hypothetical protein
VTESSDCFPLEADLLDGGCVRSVGAAIEHIGCQIEQNGVEAAGKSTGWAFYIQVPEFGGCKQT